MSTITIDSHDVLGKLSIVKNYLSVILENHSLSDKDRGYIKRAFQAAEDLILYIKQQSPNK